MSYYVLMYISLPLLLAALAVVVFGYIKKKNWIIILGLVLGLPPLSILSAYFVGSIVLGLISYFCAEVIC